MPANIQSLLNNTKQIFMTDSILETLLDFERVLDELDLYAFSNWKSGELVEGPIYEKYFVRCTFMWPYSKMPDPRGGARLTDYDCEVNYKQDYFSHPKKVKDPKDFRPGTKVPKIVDTPVWLVEIVMPKKLMHDIEQGALELESGTVDIEDVDQAYETGANDDLKSSGAAPEANMPGGEPNA